jgi:hypothetical protein
MQSISVTSRSLDEAFLRGQDILDISMEDWIIWAGQDQDIQRAAQ